MAKQINLDTVISRAIHRPVSADKKPLYRRPDGYTTNSENHSDSWNKLIETNYSSPNNIRRIFITHDGVILHLYKPFKTTNQSLSGKTEIRVSYESLFEADDDKSFDPNYLMMQLQNELAVNANLILSGYSQTLNGIKGTGLGALKSDVSASNVEEIYFDWTLFLTSDFATSVKFWLGTLSKENSGNGVIFNNDKIHSSGITEIIYRIFASSIKDNATINRTFQRLKYVGYISKLQEIYDKSQRKPGRQDVQGFCTPWLDNPVVSQLVKGQGNGVFSCIYRIPQRSRYIATFALRQEYYYFDTEVLRPYFNEWSAKIANYQRESQAVGMYKNTQTNSANTTTTTVEKSPFEKMLDNISHRSLDAAKKMAKQVYNASERSRQETLNLLSDEGKKRYLDL